VPLLTKSVDSRPRRRSLLHDSRGSIFVEALVYIPFLILIWVLLNHTHRVMVTDIATQRVARTCSWKYASSGCDSPPSGCGASKTVVDDLVLRGLGTGSFETLAAELPFIAPQMAVLHGELAEATVRSSIERPAILGGSREFIGHHAMMCNTKTREWEQILVYPLFCLILVDGWCFGF
jgi:hypothetical protein